MKTYAEWRYISAPFFSSALDGSEWLASHPGHLIPREVSSSTYWMRGWWPQGWFGCFIEDKPLAPAGTQTPIPWPCSPQSAAIPTEHIRVTSNFRSEEIRFESRPGISFRDTGITPVFHSPPIWLSGYLTRCCWYNVEKQMKGNAACLCCSFRPNGWRKSVMIYLVCNIFGGTSCLE
jgi:hypothetical protein